MTIHTESMYIPPVESRRVLRVRIVVASRDPSRASPGRFYPKRAFSGPSGDVTRHFSTRAMFAAPPRASTPPRERSRATVSGARRAKTTTRALFGRKEPEAPPPPPPKKSLFSFGGTKTTRETPKKTRDVEYASQETMSDAYARIRKQRAFRKAEFEAKEKGPLASALFSVTRALDFQEDIKEDRGLLRAAGRMQKGDKMSTEQYGALRRKVGGTKSGFFGESVDVEGSYVDSGYVDIDDVDGDVTAKGFLALVVVGVLATTVWVASQVP